MLDRELSILVAAFTFTVNEADLMGRTCPLVSMCLTVDGIESRSGVDEGLLDVGRPLADNAIPIEF
jgi:hypothetical protein